MYQKSAKLIMLGAALAAQTFAESVFEASGFDLGVQTPDNSQICEAEKNPDKSPFEKVETCNLQAGFTGNGSAETANLLKEVMQAGGLLKKVEVHEFNLGNNGLMATEDIEAGELICFIPEELFVTVKMGLETPLVRHMLQNDYLTDDADYDSLILQLLIMQERRNPETRLVSFLQSIPKNWTNFPILYSQEDAEYLHGSSLAQWTQAELDFHKVQYQQIASFAPEFGEQFSFDEFLETSRAVKSRIFDFKDGDRLRKVMMPVGDLFNHRNPPDLIWKYGTDHDGRKGWTYTAMKPVKRGQQVFISYGSDKTNQQLLPVYGFIDDGNTVPFKSYLTLRIRKSDPLLEPKMRILGGKEHKIVIDQVPDVVALSQLRLASLDPTEDKQKLAALLDSPTPYSGEKIAPISLQNEIKAIQTLAKMCAKAIQAFPRTFKEDIEQLESATLSFNQRNALKYTLHERNALIKLVNLAEWISDTLLQEPQEAVKALKGKLVQEPGLDRYFVEDLIPLLRNQPTSEHPEY